MSKHLNADQMAKWAAGDRRPELEQHLGECAACRLAMENFQTALSGWRDAVRGWSDRQYQVAQQRMSAREMSVVSRRSPVNLYWAAGMAMCAFVAVLLWYAGPIPVTERSVASSPIADSAGTESGRATNSDAVLMRQVDREVSQTVPDAMEPLMGLVSWDGSATADENAAGGRSHAKQVE